MKKEYRVKKSSEIEKIVKNKQSVGNKYFVIYKKENHDNNHFRLAVSVSKKFGNAVQRNLIKRRVREIMSKQDIKPNYDVFVVVKINTNELDFTSIRKNLLHLVEKHKILR